MTQAPRRLFDASSTGSSGSVQLFARLETSPCALTGCTPIHESQPPTRTESLEFSRTTTARTETFTRVVLCGKITPSLFRGEKGAAFVPGSLVGNACWKTTAINHRDVNCTSSSLPRIPRYLPHEVEVSNKFRLATCINFYSCALSCRVSPYLRSSFKFLKFLSTILLSCAKLYYCV